MAEELAEMHDRYTPRSGEYTDTPATRTRWRNERSRAESTASTARAAALRRRYPATPTLSTDTTAAR